jgi:cytoskeletal protein RodZ
MTSDSASRVTRSRRSLWRSALLFVAVLAGVTVLRAQETVPNASPPQATAAQSGATVAEDATPVASGDSTPESGSAANDQQADDGAAADTPEGQDGKPAGKVGPTKDHFEPTEKVRADFDVSFPVDI